MNVAPQEYRRPSWPSSKKRRCSWLDLLSLENKKHLSFFSTEQNRTVVYSVHLHCTERFWMKHSTPTSLPLGLFQSSCNNILLVNTQVQVERKVESGLKHVENNQLEQTWVRLFIRKEDIRRSSHFQCIYGYAGKLHTVKESCREEWVLRGAKQREERDKLEGVEYTNCDFLQEVRDPGWMHS